MIYVLTLLVCFYLVWKYDLRGETRYKEQWYKGLLIWYILLSALQYYVGSDMPLYIEKYEYFHEKLTFNAFLENANERVQPGWLILTWFCKLFTNNFILMKIIQAIFFNIAIFSFFKRESKYLFLCIFFFSLNDYLVTNFNVLRQSYAIAFGLYAVSYLKKEKYAFYFLFVVLAFMFHNSAVLLLVIPIFKNFKPNKVTIPLAIIAIAIAFYALYRLNIESLAGPVLDSGMMGESSADIAMAYMNDYKLGATGGAKFTVRIFVVALVVGYYILKRKEFFWGGFGLAYLFFLVLTTILPILWRYRLFFDIPYFVMLSQLIVEYPLKNLRRVKMLFYVGCIIVYMYFPLKDYFYKGPYDKHAYIDQYYPYHSIFDPIKEERE